MATTKTTTEIDVVSAEVYKIIMMNAKRSKYNEEVVSENIPTEHCICVWSGELGIRVSTMFHRCSRMHIENESKACIVSVRVNLFLSAFVVFGFSFSAHSVCTTVGPYDIVRIEHHFHIVIIFVPDDEYVSLSFIYIAFVMFE